MNSQGQADADLYMGVTTVVAVSDARRGAVDLPPRPASPLSDGHGRLDRQLEPVGQTPEWALKLREGARRPN